VHDVFDDGFQGARRVPQRAARDAPAARLVAREARPVGEKYARAVAGEVKRGRRSGGTGPDDEDVDPFHGAMVRLRALFDHVTIRVSDREASEAFHSTVLHPLGIEQSYSGPDFAEWDPSRWRPRTPTIPSRAASTSVSPHLMYSTTWRGLEFLMHYYPTLHRTPKGP
jgi:hypothetical protein